MFRHPCLARSANTITLAVTTGESENCRRPLQDRSPAGGAGSPAAAGGCGGGIGHRATRGRCAGGPRRPGADGAAGCHPGAVAERCGNDSAANAFNSPINRPYS